MPSQIRDARRNDAAEIRDFTMSFFASLGTPLDPIPTLAKVRSRLAAPNIITVIEPGVGMCEFKLKLDDKVAKIESLYPRGVDTSILKPILQGGLDRGRARAAADWEVWASFWGGIDADGTPDGGESECLAWQLEYPGTRVFLDDSTGLWRIEATLGELTQ